MNSDDPGISPERELALGHLPDAHALALRLTDAGLPLEMICAELGIEPEGLDLLLDVARRKLRKELKRP